MSISYPTDTVHGTQAHGLFELRMERDRLLAECDWTQGADSPLSDSQKSEWATYRQSLRDITTTYSTVPLCPKGMLDWGQITWPTKP